MDGSTEIKEMTLEGLNTEIKLLVEELPGPNMLNLINLSCNNDVFLETLMGNIRNSIVSLQTWYKKVEQCKTALITKRLNILKGDYLGNQDEIFELETILTGFRDRELEIKIKNMKIFQHLHHERPSPLFLNLIKRNHNKSLTGICNDDGEQFATEKQRNKHIVDTFEKIYVR
jgi:hypothetical protein